MKYLDLVGGRAEVESRFREAVKTKLDRMRIRDIIKLERTLALRESFFYDLHHDKQVTITKEVVLNVLRALDINLNDALPLPKLTDEQVIEIYQDMQRQGLGVLWAYAEPLQDNLDHFGSLFPILKAFEEFEQGEGLGKTVPPRKQRG